MIHFENTIEIGRPVEEVFEFVAHFENVPKWNYYVSDVRQLSEGRPDVGMVYHQMRRDDQQDYMIVDYQPHSRLTVRATPDSSPAFERSLVFEPTASGTRLLDSWELDTGRNPIIERLGAGRVKAAVAENLGKLKELLETGVTRLQDGRVSKL